MDNSRPSSPDEPPQDLWSSILDSVSSSRSIPAKQILLLGQPSTGKSTLAAALLQKTSTDEVKEDQRLDFALGYDWADVRDDADEGMLNRFVQCLKSLAMSYTYIHASSCIDTLARLSVYTVPSAASSYTALLPHFLPPRNSLPHTVVVIVLDWTRPWTFVEELQTWLSWVEEWVKGDNARELVIAREENHERRELPCYAMWAEVLTKGTLHSTGSSATLHRTFHGAYTDSIHIVEYSATSRSRNTNS